MKTPREILMAQHRAAEPKLDALRRELVAQCGEGRRVAVSASKAGSAKEFLRLLWRELIFPSRHLWAGLAGTWVLILAAHFSLRDPAASGPAKIYVPSMMSLQEQQKLLNALLTDRYVPVEADKPKPFTPRPSGERTAVLAS